MRIPPLSYFAIAIALCGVVACGGSTPTPTGHWTLDKPAARAAFSEAAQRNPAVRQILSELVVDAGQTPAEALVGAIEVSYDLAADHTFSHSFKILRDVPPHLRRTELQQSGTWALKGTTMTLQPTTLNGVAVGMPPVLAELTRESMTYDAFGVTLQLRRV